MNNPEDIKMSYCTNCGRELTDGFDFCPECGAKVVSESQNTYTAPDHELTKICPRCGEKMPADAFYCLNCGATFNEQEEDFSDIQNRVKYQFGIWKNKWIALLLCIFLGWIGAHKYYEGKIGMGILYTFTLGLFFIGWIVDVIILIFKPNPYMAKR
jgi:RNA polymerase subunit RPABC4/transcription elongation factor Spt4